MRTATISIQKILTIMEKTSFGTITSCKKMGSFDSIINDFDKIQITGMAKPSKLNKYKQIMINNNFVNTNIVALNNAGFDGINSDVISFSLVFEKLV